jgi:GTP cyclohydrolase I
VGGVPHAQRSRAKIRLELDPAASAEVIDYIDLVETALGTPVQAAVKREDEQEFARLNAQNLMFCEDAGRKIKSSLNRQEEILDFRAEVTHEESLHPHDAVSIVTKDPK